MKNRTLFKGSTPALTAEGYFEPIVTHFDLFVTANEHALKLRRDLALSLSAEDDVDFAALNIAISKLGRKACDNIQERAANLASLVESIKESTDGTISLGTTAEELVESAELACRAIRDRHIRFMMWLETINGLSL